MKPEMAEISLSPISYENSDSPGPTGSALYPEDRSHFSIHLIAGKRSSRIWTSGVRNSRKPNLCHFSFLETLYVGAILCAADWDYARMHEQLSGVANSRKLRACANRRTAYVTRGRTKAINRFQSCQVRKVARLLAQPLR